MTLPAERTKTNQTHLVYLNDMMMDIINQLPVHTNSAFIFTGARGVGAKQFSKSKKELDAQMLAYLKREGHLADGEILERWTLHDLRRTARTGFSRLKIEKDVKKKLLNHKLGGMDDVYDMWEYFDEKKEALERWCALVRTIISTK